MKETWEILIEGAKESLVPFGALVLLSISVIIYAIIVLGIFQLLGIRFPG